MEGGEFSGERSACVRFKLLKTPPKKLFPFFVLGDSGTSSLSLSLSSLLSSTTTSDFFDGLVSETREHLRLDRAQLVQQELFDWGRHFSTALALERKS